MAQVLVKNNAYSTLAAGINSSVTSLTVATGHGARFPTVSGGNVFYATLIDVSNNLEIVKVSARAGDVFTIARGQDGTTARAFATNDRIELRPVAALFDDKLSLGGGTLTGAVSVPAGATLTQVPQVQEVVKRAGDSMTGALTVPELRGVSGAIAVPTGHRLTGADTATFVAPGMVIQQASVQSGAAVASTVAIPWDDTIPQITEGTEAFNLAFTPKFATSKLRIDVVLVVGTTSNSPVTGALFRDAVADALAAAAVRGDDNNPETLTFTHYMTSPGTSTYTFRVRFGVNSTSVITLNGSNSARKFGGVSASSMIITEIAQ